MTQEEYEQQKKLIVEQFGEPKRDFDNTPLNESAKRLATLVAKMNLQPYTDVKKARSTEKKIKEGLELSRQYRPVPPEVIRNEFLSGFNDTQKLVVKQWIKNTAQSEEEIASAVGTSVIIVHNTMQLEAFKALRLNLTKGLLEIAPLEAILTYLECMRSKFDNIRFNAADAILRNQGILKDKSPETVITNEVVMDKAKLDELKAFADKRYKS